MASFPSLHIFGLLRCGNSCSVRSAEVIGSSHGQCYQLVLLARFIAHFLDIKMCDHLIDDSAK